MIQVKFGGVPELLAHYGDIKTAAAIFAANPALADDPEALANAAGNGHESFVRLMLRCQRCSPFLRDL